MRAARIRQLLGILFVAYGAAAAWSLRWVCDDAFISFRYARNLTRGNGLVFNVGERVEGYTNFLWTLLCALGLKLGADPVDFSMVVGVVCFSGTLVYAYHLGSTNNRTHSVVPVATGALALHYHAQVYGTSGLETALFTLLVTAAAFHLERNHNTAGVVLATAATLTRPDGILFALAGGLYCLHRDFRKAGAWFPALRSSLLTWLPFGITLTLFAAWKAHYYGSILPNTYYAKSGGGWDLQRGLTYVGLYGLAYYGIFLAALATLVVVMRKWWQSGAGFDFPSPGALLLFALPVVGSVLYYTKVGGGFMFGRFLIPSTVFALVLFERMLTAHGMTPRWRLIVAVVFIASVGLRYDLYAGRALPVIQGITEEHKIYRLKVVRPAAHKLEQWQPAFRNVRIAIVGSQAFMAYYLDVPVAIESSTGLTDSYVARQKSRPGAMIGHRKPAPLHYLQKRGVHIHFGGQQVPGPEFTRLKFPFGQARIIVYDSRVMRRLGGLPGFSFQRFPDYLRTYLQKKPTPAEVRAKLPLFRKYYFDHNRNPVLLRRLEAAAGRTTSQHRK